MRRKSVAILIGLVVCLTGAATFRSASGGNRADALPDPDLAAADLQARTADAGEAAPTQTAPNSASQVDAAYEDAVRSLTREVSAARIAQDLTVGDLVDRTGGRDELARTLNEARRVGGTRWIGAKESEICQVQLEIAGDQVAATALRLAEADPARAGVPVERLRRDLQPLKRRTFSATGTSLRPRVLDKVWYLVSDADRRKALRTAQGDAVDRLLANVRDVELAPGKTLGDALEDAPPVRQAVNDWLVDRPVVDLEYGQGLEVRLTLSAPAEELWEVLRSALEAQPQSAVSHPTTDTGWQRLRGVVLERLSRAGPPEGTAAAPAPTRRIELPRPPRWIDDQVPATASAPPPAGPPRLAAVRAAGTARQRAREQARSKVLELPLKRDLTLAQAAAQDRRIGDAVDRVIARTQPSKILYTRDGGAQASVTVNLMDVWREIESLYLADSETADGGFGPER